MNVPTWWPAGAVVALLATPVAIHGLHHVRAAVRQRRARDACPFEADDQDHLSALRALQLVVAESLLWWYVVLTAAHPPRGTVPGPPSHVPVMVLPPPLLPRASVRMLVARLRRDGFPVVCPRLVTVARSRVERIRGLDRALRTTWDELGARVLDVIAPAGAAAIVAAHLASGGSGVPVIRRLLTLGAAGADDPVIPPPTEVIAFYSPDDPLLGRLDEVPRPGAFHVAIRGSGRLGLLHAPYVYTLIREHLLAPLARPSSWTSAAS
jgi:hypothetical protein